MSEGYRNQTRLGFVRHGLTDWNRLGRLQGHRDTPLNETGLAQADRIAGRFEPDSWDIIVSSDLLRARMTAERIAIALKLATVHEDFRLRERHYGPLEGTTEEERRIRWGIEGFPEDPAYGVESNESIGSRGWHCVKDWTAAHPGQRILFVSHGGTIRMMFAMLLDEPELIGPGNTALGVVWKIGREFRPCLYNCMTHLE